MGSKSAPAPQQAYPVQQAPTYSETSAQRIASIPQEYEAKQKYDPLYNQLDWEQLQKYTPLVNDLMAAEQQRLSPNQYALNEDLAQQALTGSKADLPALMKQSALDTFRSEIGSNVGSPIGAEYTSRNLAQLGEQYRNNYQNMGLSLLNKFPTQAQSATPQGNQGLSAQNLNSSYGTQMQGYGAYQSALANSYYQPAPSSSRFNIGGLVGGGIGAVAGNALVPGMGGIYGAGLGYGMGSQF
jgi:hypothetical protein